MTFETNAAGNADRLPHALLIGDTLYALHRIRVSASLAVRMSKISSLQAAETLSDLAELLGVRPADLSFALYLLPDNEKYRSFNIPKKNGGFRTITAPAPRLAYIQRQLAGLLAPILDELEAQRAKRECIVSHGFRSKLSIVTNARNHRRKQFVFNADLKDFFPSINFGRVYGYFIKNKHFNLRPKIATLIAQIACFQNQLPQGSPCSPVISNFIASILDRHLSKLAAKYKCTYTRYADDLTFSTNEKEFPHAIARLVRGSTDKWVAGDELVRSISKSGFKVNELKTRLQYRKSRQDATGLIVNEKLNVAAQYYKLVRAMCHNLFRDGWAYSRSRGHSVPISDEQLRGKLAHLYHIRGLENDHQRIKNDKTQPAYYRLYSQFLDYRAFYGLQQPLIICEGKTDNVYVKTALQILAPKFGELIETIDGKPKLKVKFFKYGKESAILQNLSGGAGQLKLLITEYEKRMRSFRGGAKQPVIMIVDVDKGTAQIWSELTKILGKSVAGFDQYYHVSSNLYVVPVPAKAGAEKCIEDLFDSKTLNIIYDGKKFDRDSDKDKPGTYSKNTFANQVVRDNRSTIDFSGFEPLLEAVRTVLKDYASRLSAP